MDDFETWSGMKPSPEPGGAARQEAEGGGRERAPPIDARFASGILDGLAGHAFVTITPDGGHVSCSEKAATLLGSIPARIALPGAADASEKMTPLPVTRDEIVRAMSGEDVAISCRHRRPNGTEADLHGSLRLRLEPAPVLLLSLRDRGFEALLAERMLGLLQLGDDLAGADEVDAVLEFAADCLRRCCGVAEAGYDLLEGDAFDRPELRPSNRAWPDPANPVVMAQRAVLGRLSERVSVSVPDVRESARTREIAEGLERAGVRAMYNQRCHLGGRPHGVVYLHHPEPKSFDFAMAFFVSAVGDRVESALSRLGERRRQEVMNLEIAHRLRNVAGIARSIVSNGLRGVEAPEASAVRKRIEALGRAHDGLLKGKLEAAPMMEIATGALSALHGPERFRLQGADVALGPSSALNMALLLHEFATNASKYGALSTPAGTVSVAWRRETDATRNLLVLEWIEKGGPSVRAPERSGFGTRLLRLLVPDPADSLFDYAPGGLRITCRFTEGTLGS